MKIEKEIGNLIMNISDDPSPNEAIDKKSKELIDLIKSANTNIGVVLNDKELTDYINKVRNGSNSEELIKYLKSIIIPITKKFSDLINFSECSFGLSIDTPNKSEVASDTPGTVLYSSEDRKIVVNKNFGFIIDKIGKNYSVRKFSTNNSSDLTRWKLINKKLATKESLASIVK